jgi:putative intracellular protease/amidase
MASPKGGVAPLDMASVEAFAKDPSSTEFFANKKDLWEKTAPLANFLGKASEFDAIFFPGGHGPMIDLAVDPTSHKLIGEFIAADKIVSAVCHGPAALVNVKHPETGEFILKGKEVTGFTDKEEDLVQLTSAMPFLLESRMREVGGKFSSAGPWEACVRVDGKIITGQNPASGKGVGEAILKALGA